MARLSDEHVTGLARNFADALKVGSGEALETVTQSATNKLYNTYRDSIVLTRCFISVPYKKLPDTNRAWVDKLTDSVGVSDQVTDETPVLSLMATSGAEPEWNDRRKSEGHVGIPLASSAFIGAIPMMAKLLTEISGDLSWLDNRDWIGLRKQMSRFSGMFRVNNAKTDKDSQGRHIIAAQDFVNKYDVGTVFGIGGGYLDGSFAVLLTFTRETVDAKHCEVMMPAFNLYKADTLGLVTSGAIFDGA